MKAAECILPWMKCEDVNVWIKEHFSPHPASEACVASCMIDCEVTLASAKKVATDAFGGKSMIDWANKEAIEKLKGVSIDGDVAKVLSILTCLPHHEIMSVEIQLLNHFSRLVS